MENMGFMSLAQRFKEKEYANGQHANMVDGV